VSVCMYVCMYVCFLLVTHVWCAGLSTILMGSSLPSPARLSMSVMARSTGESKCSAVVCYVAVVL
jgi:hypothetical protein